MKFMGYGDVLMIPVGLKGHIDPMIYVAKGLIKYGLTITMVIQEDLRSLIDADIEEQVLGLRIQTVPPAHVRMPPWAGENTRRALESYLNKLLAERQSGAAIGPKCIIADMLQPWTQEWADKLELPRYVSCPSPATFGLVMHYFSTLMARGLLQGTDPDPVLEVPGTPLLHLSDLPPMVRRVPEFMTEGGDTFKDSAGIVINTFYELEPRAVDTLRAEVEAKGTKPKVAQMFTIGPMLPAEYFSEETSVGNSQDDSETIRWLNKRPDRSVLYVAFGSMAYLQPHEILELAHGLESSEVPFLWVLRVKGNKDEPVPDVNELLPSGFRDRTKDQGLIYTEFAPQLQILSHQATGGFLTHCGWNSSLESICRGVPMLAWPMHAEQGLNSRILVGEAKVATEIIKGPGGVVERAEVENGVKRLMTEPLGKQLKERVLELQRRARMAVAPGGSTHGNFVRFVKEIQSTASTTQ